MDLPGGDPDPLEQLEFPKELNPEDEAGGLLEAVVGDLAVLVDPLTLLTPSVLGPDTVNDVLKWCLLPDLTAKNVKKMSVISENNQINLASNDFTNVLCHLKPK